MQGLANLKQLKELNLAENWIDKIGYFYIIWFLNVIVHVLASFYEILSLALIVVSIYLL